MAKLTPCGAQTERKGGKGREGGLGQGTGCATDWLTRRLESLWLSLLLPTVKKTFTSINKS